MDTVTAEIVSFYEDRYSEATRLSRRPQSRLERIRTLELLADVLPAAPARILDVGVARARTPGSSPRTVTG